MCSEKPMGNGTRHRARREPDVSVVPRRPDLALDGRSWRKAFEAGRRRSGKTRGARGDHRDRLSARSDRSWLIAGGAAFAECERGARTVSGARSAPESAAPAVARPAGLRAAPAPAVQAREQSALAAWR